MAILGLYLVVIERGLRIAASAGDDFRSLLAAGLTLVVGVQAFIIAAGNLKLIPLTGITLPFISYGGSSLLVNGIVVGLLLALSDKGVEPPPAPETARPARPADQARGRLMARRSVARSIAHVGLALTLAFGVLAAGAGYWQVIRSEELSTAPDNPAVARRRPERRPRARSSTATGSFSPGTSRTRAAGSTASTPTAHRPGRRLREPRHSGRPASSAPSAPELTGLSDPDPIRNVLKKFQADPYDPQTADALALADAPAGRGPWARGRQRRGRHARSADAEKSSPSPRRPSTTPRRSPTRQRRRTGFARGSRQSGASRS